MTVHAGVGSFSELEGQNWDKTSIAEATVRPISAYLRSGAVAPPPPAGFGAESQAQDI